MLWPIQEIFGNKFSSTSWWEGGSRSRQTVLVICGTNETKGSGVEKYTYDSTIPTKGKWDEKKEVVGREVEGCLYMG